MPDSPTYYDVMQYLAANGLGQIGVDLFGGEWGAPDAQMLVVEGVSPVSDLPETYESPGVQILVRGSTGQRDVDVYRRAKTVYDFLVNAPDCLDINGTQYAGFEPSTNLAGLGQDANERFAYSMNFTTFRNGARGP